MKDILQEPDIKAEFRKNALSKRDSIPLPVRKIKDSSIFDRLLHLNKFRESKTVLLYASFRSEVGTEDIIKKTLEMGKTVLLPKVNPQETRLELYRITGFEELSPGYMGILEPETSEHTAGIESVELAVIPGAAFDSYGHRLGYGKGYYDKLLHEVNSRPLLISLAYEEQLLKDIPAETHDVKMDIILTDRRLIGCRGKVNGQEEN